MTKYHHNTKSGGETPSLSLSWRIINTLRRVISLRYVYHNHHGLKGGALPPRPPRPGEGDPTASLAGLTGPGRRRGVAGRGFPTSTASSDTRTMD